MHEREDLKVHEEVLVQKGLVSYLQRCLKKKLINVFCSLLPEQVCEGLFLKKDFQLKADIFFGTAVLGLQKFFFLAKS